MQTTDTWAIIGRGIAGWHAEGRTIRTGPTSSQSSKVSGAYAETDGARLARNAEEGAPIYDASNVTDRDAFARLVIGGPMVCADLPPGTWTGCKYSQPPQPYSPGMVIGSLSYVAPDVKIALLRALPGVRVGTVRAGRIAWES